ncbi:4'-phosphopantetheinyl transferase family protein [Flavobacterium granuli]|uniref:4'-phosphopantetheinyl transferase superfamily protein n=1 Tax=Flavobacterium granuli TaxID=280093 RepID=A0A1M5MJR6_9FLAO|nr:4'-phosphopantetheinyl transferase superfamily protein [Flavobacterium granuli]PRZ24977.1 4'-phosphopantetheinyl transferase superfamily protein [Flavobacterium granuli]SHG77486.1 4'-phosphopantetheinyl transferase superfamily protein [Flavobacterium granuli]
MPLYKTINSNASTQILVWKITESFDELFDAVVLNENNLIRLNGMKSELHQRAFLSVRKLLQEAGYSDLDLYYDEFGKPHLKDDKHISITHSHNFSAIIISDEIVGIDIELQREKIIRIADKFINEKELSRLRSIGAQDYIKKLTVKWGAKEAIFKIRNEKGISFKDHIKVNAFEIIDAQAIAELHFGGLVKEFKIYFEEIEGFTLVYAFEKN